MGNFSYRMREREHGEWIFEANRSIMVKQSLHPDPGVIFVRILDPLDIRLLLALLAEPRAQIGELGERLGVARNTVQAHLRRLERSGAVRRGGRDVDLAAVGYDVVAFVTIEVTHRDLDGVIASLRAVPQVLEVYEISGRGDVWCRLAARDVHHLQGALRQLLRIKGVIRTETSLALHEHIPYRLQPLLEGMGAQPERRQPDPPS